MFSRVISQRLAPLRMGAIMAFNSSLTVVSLRHSSSMEAPRDFDRVLVEAYYRQPLLPEEAAALAELPTKEQLLVKKAPQLVDKIAWGIRDQLDKHIVGEETKITNDFTHFDSQKKELSGLIKEVKGLRVEAKKQRDFRQKADRQEAYMNKAEWHQALVVMRDVLRSRYLAAYLSKASTSSCKTQPQASAPEAQAKGDAPALVTIPGEEDFPDFAATKAIRNRLAHALVLKPCLHIVDEDPTLEPIFEALFGVSSQEAKTLSQFDDAEKFHVDTILSEHARLWKSGLADTFVGPFHLWLDAMRQLLSTQNPSEIDPALVSSAEGHAKEARDKAVADWEAADARGLCSPARMRKELGRKQPKVTPDPYQWAKIVSDWEERGLLQKFKLG